MEAEKESVDMNVEVVMATEIEQADGDEGTVDSEMSVDEADENELLDSDIDEEDINPDKEELDQAAEGEDQLDQDDKNSDEPVQEAEAEMSADEADENELLDSDIDEEDINPDKEELDQAGEEVDQLEQDDKNSDEPVQEADKSLTTDKQVDADTAVKDSTKTVNKNKTNDLPEKEIPKKIESLNGVTAEENTPERRSLRRQVIVYPLTEDDLEGSALNPVLTLASFSRLRFRGSRGRSKKGVLDMAYIPRNCTSKDEPLKLLAGVKLCGGIQPKVVECSQHDTFFKKLDELQSAMMAVDSLTGNKATEEQPVSVFVNNIPLDIRVEMLHFLYPLAGSIQLPVNSQSAVQGYAIIEFPNLNEAKTVVKNNRAYPAQIGGKYLNMYVIGHEGETDKPEPPTDKVEKKRTNEQSSKSPERSQKRSLSESKSSNPKRSRQDDDKRGSPSTTGSATKTQSKTVSNKEESIEDKRVVCFGDVPNCKQTELLHFIKREFLERGLCERHEKPVTRMDFEIGRNFQYVEFSHFSEAEVAIEELQGAIFKGSPLTTKVGHIEEASTTEICSKCISNEGKLSGEEPTRVVINNLPSTVDRITLNELIREKLSNSGKIKSWQNPLMKYTFLDHTYDGHFQVPNFTCHHLASYAVTCFDGMMYAKRILRAKLQGSGKHANKIANLRTEKVASVEDQACTVYIGNTKSKATFAEFKTAFENALIEHGVCKPGENPVKEYKFKKRQQLFQFVKFHNDDQAKAAIQALHETDFMGKKLIVRLATKEL